MRRPVKIKLTWYEIAACAGTGVRRRLEAIRRGIKDAPGFDRKDKWSIDIEGSCGEMAAAKALDRYWNSSVNTFAEGDVGQLQVRTSRRSEPLLIVQPKNDPDALYILVSGQVPAFEVHGWAYGRDVQKKKHLRTFGTRPAVYALPPSLLRSLEELPNAGLV